MTPTPERVDAKAILAKWKAARGYWHSERDSHKGSWPSVNASVSAEIYDALSQALADLDTLETDAAPFAAQIAQRKTYTITKDRTYTLANGEMDEMTPWVGEANDVRIHVRALTAQEIADRSTRTPVPDQMDAKAMADYRGALLDSLRTVASHLLRERRLRPIQTTNSYENACIDSFIANINVVADIMFLPVRLDAAEKYQDEYARLWHRDAKRLEAAEEVACRIRDDNALFLEADKSDNDGAGCASIHDAVIRICEDVLAAIAGEETKVDLDTAVHLLASMPEEQRNAICVKTEKSPPDKTKEKP